MPVYVDGRINIGGSGQADQAIHPGVDMLSNLQAIPASSRFPNMVIFVASEETQYYWDNTSVAAPAPPNVIKPDDITLPDPGRWIQFGGTGGGVNKVEYVKVAFDFNTISPLTLLSLSAGQTVTDCEVVITEEFDDPSTSLSVGVDADHDAIVPQSENIPTEIGIYASRRNSAFLANEGIRLWISVGASTQGKGEVVLQVKLA